MGLVHLTWWTWVEASSGSWWWTGKPGVLQPMGSQRVGHDWATELTWAEGMGLAPLAWLFAPRHLFHLYCPHHKQSRPYSLCPVGFSRGLYGLQQSYFIIRFYVSWGQRKMSFLFYMTTVSAYLERCLNVFWVRERRKGLAQCGRFSDY